MLFDSPNTANRNESLQPRTLSRAKSFLSNAATVSFISAATAVMMLCPCDTVGIHDHYALSLVALAALFGAAAAFLIFLRLRRDSGITGFLRAVTAMVIAGLAIYAELFAAMKVVAWLARPH